MSLVKFSEYANALPVHTHLVEALDNEMFIIEWSEEDWQAMSESDRTQLMSEAEDGVVWTVEEESCDACGMDPCICQDVDEEEDIDEYTARNTMKRRATQKVKDKKKFSDRATKLKAKIDRKKGGAKVKRKKTRMKWMRKNKSKIKNAQKVFGGKVKSKFTKKK